MRLIGVVHKAGRRPEHREVHRHLGRAVSLVSYDAVEVELADESSQSRPVSSSLGRAVVAHLRLSLGEHRYMVTPDAASRLGPLLGHRRRSSQLGPGQERLAPAPGRTLRVGVVRGGPAHEAGEQVESDH